MAADALAPCVARSSAAMVSFLKYSSFNIRRVNRLRLRQNGHLADDIFECIFFDENVWISIKIPLKFVPKGPISNIPALVQIMAWRRPGDKPLSEPMVVSLLTHIWVSRPQWVNRSHAGYNHMLTWFLDLLGTGTMSTIWCQSSLYN